MEATLYERGLMVLCLEPIIITAIHYANQTSEGL